MHIKITQELKGETINNIICIPSVDSFILVGTNFHVLKETRMLMNI